MRAYRMIILLAAYIFFLIGIFAAVYEYNRTPANTSGLKPDFTISATALQEAFETNETEASSKYINKIVEVTGTISAVSQLDSGTWSIMLKTANTMSSVICTMHGNTPIQVSEGDGITIRGECSGYLMDVLLNNCVIIK